MINITISEGILTVDNKSYYSVNFEAYAHEDRVNIRNIYDKNLKVFKGHVHYQQLNINNVVSTSASDTVKRFNDLIGAAGISSNYPDILFTATIEADEETPITNAQRAGYVTITAAETNAGNILIGVAGLPEGVGQLEPGKSIGFELANLSLIHLENTSEGDVAYVFGAYHSI